MGRNAGFHAGEVFGDVGVKSRGSFVPNRIVLRKADADVTYISGTAAVADAVGSNAVPVESLRYSAWAVNKATFNTVVPSGVPETAKADVRLLWTTMSGIESSNVGDVISGVNVAWDVDYRTFRVLVSGANIANVADYYTISGAWLNATTTGTYNASTEMVSGAINETVVSIPATDFRAGEVLQFMVVRDAVEAVDTLNAPVHLIYSIVEYK